MRHAGVALHHRVLHFDRAADRIDHAAELYDCAVAHALDHPAPVHGDGRIDEIAAQRSQPRDMRFSSVPVRREKPTTSAGQNRGESLWVSVVTAPPQRVSNKASPRRRRIEPLDMQINDATGFLPASSGQPAAGDELLLQIDARAKVDRRHAERFGSAHVGGRVVNE
jgi:hypothetical protein